MEALKSQQEVEADVASEIQGVRIILTKSGQIWLVCETSIFPRTLSLAALGQANTPRFLTQGQAQPTPSH